MNRREFFLGGLRKLQEAVVSGIDTYVSARAEHWIRPPYALDEMEFLLACKRCGDCIRACPHGVIFALPLRRGVQVAGTPALDLLHNACHLCEDWPCVRSCKEGALQMPEGDEDDFSMPAIAVARVETQRCLPYVGPECGACQGVCPINGAMDWDQGKPSIDSSLCVGCALCREACVLPKKAIDIQSRHKTENTSRRIRHDKA